MDTNSEAPGRAIVSLLGRLSDGTRSDAAIERELLEAFSALPTRDQRVEVNVACVQLLMAAGLGKTEVVGILSRVFAMSISSPEREASPGESEPRLSVAHGLFDEGKGVEEIVTTMPGDRANSYPERHGDVTDYRTHFGRDLANVDDGTIVLFDGVPGVIRGGRLELPTGESFDAPSPTAVHIRGGGSYNGWVQWRLEDGRTLADAYDTYTWG